MFKKYHLLKSIFVAGLFYILSPAHANYSGFNGNMYPTALEACESHIPGLGGFVFNDPACYADPWEVSGIFVDHGQVVHSTSTKLRCELTANTICPDYSSSFGRILLAKHKPDFQLMDTEDSVRCELEGNPCDVTTGWKVESATDLNLANLKFSRFYNSGSFDSESLLGARWHHSFDIKMDGYSAFGGTNGVAEDSRISTPNRSAASVHNNLGEACTEGWKDLKSSFRNGTLINATAQYSKGLCQITHIGSVVARLPVAQVGAIWRPVTPARTISMPDGVRYVFQKIQYNPVLFAEANGRSVSLERYTGGLYGGYDFIDEVGTRYRFIKNLLARVEPLGGKPIEIQRDDAGRIQSISVIDSSDLINLFYDDEGLLSQIESAGKTIKYRRDSHNNLTEVIYEDETSVSYHYEDSDFPNHLTGITDQNSGRYATWIYDNLGRAVSSEHAGGVDRVEMEYLSDRTIVTDSNGAQRTYHLENHGGQHVVSLIEGDRCGNCNLSDGASRDYDEFGRLILKTDWRGNITSYSFNSDGLEESRTEALGTDKERTITTTWHTDFPKPVRINEPTRVIGMTYDDNGRLLSRKVSAISD